MEKPTKLNLKIGELKKDLLLTEGELEDLFLLKEKDLLNYKFLEDLPYNSLNNLNQFENQIENINKINKEYLPDEYTHGAGTYISSIRLFFNYIKNKYNAKIAEDTLSKFGITKSILKSNNLMTNIKLFNDLLSYCVFELGFTKKDIKQLAILSYVEGKRKSIIDLTKQTLSPDQLLNTMANNSQKYELNFHYNLKKIEDKKYIMESRSRESINNTLNVAKISSEINNFYKKECIEIVPILTQNQRFSVTAIDTSIGSKQQKVDYHILI